MTILNPELQQAQASPFGRQPATTQIDADGNLTQDGRWQHTWDAENRLTSVTALTGIPDAAKGKAEYVSDWQGRMIQRSGYVWSGGAYSLQSTHKFVYDGWRIVAELTASGTPVWTYTWGQDLSGSLDGAGGGLLMVRDEVAGKTYSLPGKGSTLDNRQLTEGWRWDEVRLWSDPFEWSSTMRSIM